MEFIIFREWLLVIGLALLYLHLGRDHDERL